MLRIDAAIQATARALPAKLALGESQSGPATRTITLANDAGTDVTYTVSKVDTIDNDPGTFTPIADYAESTVSFSASTLTVRAGRTASVRVTISPSADLPDGSLYGGYVVFTPADEAHTIRVPYAGYKGDYQSIKVLQPTALDFPWLAKLDPASGNLFKQIEGATFNVTAGDLPVFLAHLDQQAYTFRIRIYDAAGREWGYAAAENFEVRNTTATGFFGWTWDGSTTVGILNQRPFATVPAGTYTAQIQVLKANGNPFNLADWETWTSPSFNVVR